MRHTPGRATLAAMKIAPRKQCVTFDAAIDRSVIHGTLTAASGARRNFHGCLKQNHDVGVGDLKGLEDPNSISLAGR